MKHPFILWLAILFSLLTATSHATHYKGGTLSWARVTTEPGFTVRANVTISYDLTTDIIVPTDPQTPKVNGVWVYTDEMPVTATSSTDLKWGDGDTSALTQFKVVAVDYAAQIVTVQATQESLITHPYAADGNYTMAIIGASRDSSEELANRQGSAMRVESTVAVNLASPSGNRPPAFSPAGSNLVIVNKGNITFQAPVATDADGDPVRYRFVTLERNATDLDAENEDPSWESLNGLTMTTAGVISWNTSAITQTVHTRAIQVVAEDLDGAGAVKSHSAVEFQVWVNTPNQPGYPEIKLAPDFTSYTAIAGQPFQFRILGTDQHDPEVFENSRLKVLIPQVDMPAGSALVPSGGFAGVGTGLETEGHHGSQMEAIFWWTPPVGDVGTTKTLHIQVEDEDLKKSVEKVVTITVVSSTTLQPLQISISPAGTVEDDHVYFSCSPGEEVSFTVTGTCATASAQLQLLALEKLPEEADLDPVLPVNGSSSVQSTFTWTPAVEDCTRLSHPHLFTFVTADVYGREVSKKVAIYVLPDLPTITFAPGELTSIAAAPWKTVMLDVKVAGGTVPQPSLTVRALDAGGFPEPSVESMGTATFVWRVLPGQASSGILRLEVVDPFEQTAVLNVPYTFAYPPVQDAAPQWWTARNVVVSGGTVKDFGMANQGQLKSITKAAYEAIKAEYPNLDTTTAGGNLATYVNDFSTTTGNYSPAAQGQVKHAANLVYRAIEAATDKYHGGVPWTVVTTDDQSYAPATVGQIKSLYSFPTPISALFNDPPSVALTMTITNPTPTGTINTRSVVSLNATASDGDGSIASVKFYLNGSELGTDTTPENGVYSVAWSPTVLGSYVIKAVATDNLGTTRETSLPATVFQWENTLPTVTFTSPDPDGKDYTIPATVIVTVTATDVDTAIKKVTFTHYNPTTQTTVTHVDQDGAPYEMPIYMLLTPSPANTPHTVAVTAEDMDNGVSASISRSFDVVRPSGTTPAVLELQEGVNGYLGMTDATMNQDAPGTPHNGTTLTLQGGATYLTNPPNMGVLMRWDLTNVPLPTNAVIKKVAIKVQTTLGGGGESEKYYRVCQLLKPWVETEATWTKASATLNWEGSGATGNEDRVEGPLEDSVLGNFGLAAPDNASYTKELDTQTNAKDLVQGWVSTSQANNYGFLIYGYGGSPPSSMTMYSSEHTNPAHRPALIIHYTVP